MKGVILAGGRSRRMGQNKAGIVLGGVTLLERAANNLKNIFPRVLVVTSPEQEISLPDVESVQDIEQGYGSLMGVYTGLKHAGESAFVVACDMPFLQEGLIRHMVEKAPGHDVVVPRPGGLYEPLHAIYSPACLPFMEQAIERKERRITSFYEKVKVLSIEDEVLHRLDPEGIGFFNINSPDDLAQAEEILSKKG